MTGSVKSPPGGETDRIMLSEPILPFMVSTTPARSRKPGQPGSEVRGIAFLPGHLFEGSRDLAQRLGPAGKAVGKEQDMVPHVPVIFRHGDRRIDGSLAGGNRHVRGVHHEDRPLPERPLGPGVLQFLELGDHVRHLVAALAAAHVDHDVHVGELRHGLLQDGLARAEPAGEDGRAAAREGEEEIDAPLPGDERRSGRELFPVGPRDPHGPLVAARDLPAVLVLSQGLVKADISVRDARDLAAPRSSRT